MSPARPEPPKSCPRCGSPLSPAGEKRERLDGGPWALSRFWVCADRRCGRIVVWNVPAPENAP